MTSAARPQQPSWPEALIGLLVFAIVLFGFALAFHLLPNDPVVQGVVGSTAGGLAGVAGFAAAFGLRIRSLHAFGVRSVSSRWLAIAVGLGLLAYVLSYSIQLVYADTFGNDGPQNILHAAARGGLIPFFASLLGGAVFTPFGEEILFRGVIANWLNRYGIWAGVGLSSVIFGVAHGVSVILPLAIMVGVLAAILFRATGSIWPGVVLHCVYNGANSVASALHMSPM